MNNSSRSARATEFTNDWAQFEVRLAGVLRQLAQPSLNDTVRLRYPSVDRALGEIILEGTFGPETSDIGLEPRRRGYVIGVSVTLPGMSPYFYPIADDPEQVSEAASAVCAFLREEALVAHPSLLTAEADRISRTLLEPLGLPGPDGVPREAEEPKERNSRRRLARRGDRELGTLSLDDLVSEELCPELSWPKSSDEVHEAVEQALILKYGTAPMDIDGDFVVDSTAEGGGRFYLTAINDRPTIAFRKAVVIQVKSRQAAVVEANYLNREVADIRWVLRGHTLYQELSFPTNPFVTVRFVEMLDQFGLRYRDNVSALRMRLGDD